MANPPFNLSNWGAEQLKDDVRWQYGMPPAGNANFAWLQHMIYHLAPGGRMGMVLANGSLSSQSGGEGEIRKNIVNADLVDCIIAMPTQLFYTTQIPVSLWFISKRKKQPGKTLFIDARKMGVMVSRKLRELTDGKVHLCQLPCGRVGILSVNRNIVDVAAVVFYKLCRLHKHTTAAAAGVIHAPLERLQYRYGVSEWFSFFPIRRRG